MSWWVLLLNQYSANIVPDKDAKVPVLLWELDPRDIPRLDHYEGFPNSCYKENVEFELNGEKCVGMAYLMNTTPFPVYCYVRKISHSAVVPASIIFPGQDIINKSSRALS